MLSTIFSISAPVHSFIFLLAGMPLVLSRSSMYFPVLFSCLGA
ncbi:Uncharacterised protein [Mycobacterium tuberculosis]|nr:Uncharacterised protein [Mycobacterium tuberculosis]